MISIIMIINNDDSNDRNKDYGFQTSIYKQVNVVVSVSIFFLIQVCFFHGS